MGSFSNYSWGSSIDVNMTCENNGYFSVVVSILIGCHDPSSNYGIGGIMPYMSTQALCGQNWQGSLSGGNGGSTISFTLNPT
jgi:hypothetical protein